MSSNPDAEFEALLSYVKHGRGFDFTGYKRPSLVRRVIKRMQAVGIESYSDYMDYLEVHPNEFIHLFNTLLINVTSFFRDQQAWDCLMNQVLPPMLSDRPSNQGIRIWSAGCATGQEPYSLAMAIAEIIGIQNLDRRVKIYATDVDETALKYARQATYTAREIAGVAPDLLEQYFEPSESGYTLRKELRRSIIFGRHDLIQDTPISKINLLVCRNTLMYFNKETQAKILTRFHFALQDSGYLFLGRAEALLTQSNTFLPAFAKQHIFTKAPDDHLCDRLFSIAQTGTEATVDRRSSDLQLQEAALDNSPTAQLMVDLNGVLVLINEQAKQLFNLVSRDLGRPLQDLEISYRLLELRSCIEQAYTLRRPVSVRSVEWSVPTGPSLYLDIQVAPLIERGTTILGASITFTDVTQYKRLQEQLELSNHELEMAYEEIQSTNEELETTNEELQAANEELETTNEELQATNEELETMNEELQATSEELQTVNDELQRRNQDVNQSNAFLESILGSFKGGVVVVNRDLKVQVWSYKSEDLWGLRTFEALGQNFLNLSIGLPIEQLRTSLRACLMGSPKDLSEITLPAINRLGQRILCQVTCAPLLDTEGQVTGVVLMMEERDNP